jgi:hypothetical protein
MESQLKVTVQFDEGDLSKVGFAHNTINNKGFKCENCSRIYFYEHEYKLHMKHHKGEKSFTCNYNSCYRKFLSLENLNYHIKLSHNSNTTVVHPSNSKPIKSFISKHTISTTKSQLSKKHKRSNPTDSNARTFHLSLQTPETSSMKPEYQLLNSNKQLYGIITQGVPSQ